MCKCQICQNETDNILYIGIERMFGMGNQFQYFKCSNCGCLQIASIPQNMGKYYPPNYFSYVAEIKTTSLKSRIANKLLKMAIAQRLGHFNLMGALSMFYNSYYREAYPYLNKGICDYDTKILDIGCGNGFFLNYLNSLGFKNLTGVDPFIKSDICYPNGVNVYKKYISELSDGFDFIMLHHSFEHMPDPIDVFRHLKRLLVKDGLIIIRILVIDGYAWRKYGMNWFQVDAPRHFFLHNKKTITLLAQKVKLKIVKVEFDSSGAQIINSEKYLENIPLNVDHVISKKFLKIANKKAKELNSLMDGDQACFYLKHED